MKTNFLKQLLDSLGVFSKSIGNSFFSIIVLLPIRLKCTLWVWENRLTNKILNITVGVSSMGKTKLLSIKNPLVTNYLLNHYLEN